MDGQSRLRQKLFDEQNGICYLCERPMVMKKNKVNTCTVDHVHPKSRGGREVKGACMHCNHEKGSMSAEAYRVIIGKGYLPWRGTSS